MDENKDKPKSRYKLIITLLIVLIIILLLSLITLSIFATPLKDILFPKKVAEEETSEETEKTTEEATEETEETTEPTEETTEETTKALSAPTISLEIYIGPEYSLTDNVCYYRVKANVTGNPTPTIEFNKDDSLGAWGPDKVQINLNSPSDTFVLEATATNSQGTATDSINLSWGCGVANQDPVIAKITTTGIKYINKTYGVGVSASDPDGDSLIYNWSVTGGTIDNIHAQNINWTTPSASETYTISVTVSDGKGGEDTGSTDIYVYFLYDLLTEAPGAYWKTGAGHIGFGGALNDNRGFACYRDNIKLEDGTTYTRVLETHPEWDDWGWILGTYPNLTSTITIPEGARFKAKVGYIQGATATDEVRFLLQFWDGSITIVFPSGGHFAKYDGTLDYLNIDLSSIAGRTGSVSLHVAVSGTYTQDWAVWVNPQITNFKYLVLPPKLP